MSATTVSFNRKAYFSLAGVGVFQLASYSGYSGLLILYMIEPEVGFQMSDAEAAQYYSYVRYIGIGTLLLAGILADLVIPRKLRMPIGLALSILGYFIVLVPDKNALLVSMTLIGLGYGLTFTSIYSMIGDLYVKESARRIAGFVGLGLLISASYLITEVVVSNIVAYSNFQSGYISCAIICAFAFLFRPMRPDISSDKNLQTKKTKGTSFLVLILALGFVSIHQIVVDNIDFQRSLAFPRSSDLFPELRMISLESFIAIIALVCSMLFFLLHT